MSLETKKKEMELKRAVLGKEELEFKIEERMAEIDRLKEAVKSQELTIQKIKTEIKEMGE